jgi:hypothetical protein
MGANNEQRAAWYENGCLVGVIAFGSVGGATGATNGLADSPDAAAGSPAGAAGDSAGATDISLRQLGQLPSGVTITRLWQCGHDFTSMVWLAYSSFSTRTIVIDLTRL